MYNVLLARKIKDILSFLSVEVKTLDELSKYKNWTPIWTRVKENEPKKHLRTRF